MIDFFWLSWIADFDWAWSHRSRAASSTDFRRICQRLTRSEWVHQTITVWRRTMWHAEIEAFKVGCRIKLSPSRWDLLILYTWCIHFKWSKLIPWFYTGTVSLRRQFATNLRSEVPNNVQYVAGIFPMPNTWQMKIPRKTPQVFLGLLHFLNGNKFPTAATTFGRMWFGKWSTRLCPSLAWWATLQWLEAGWDLWWPWWRLIVLEVSKVVGEFWVLYVMSFIENRLMVFTVVWMWK